MKIKILYVNGGIMNRGGIESYMMNYYRHMNKEKFQIDFIVHGYERGVYDAEIEKCGSKIYRLPVKSKNPIKYSMELKKVLLENSYDIIHSHVDAMSCWILKVAKQCNIPVRIAHSHNTDHLTTNKVKYFLNEIARKNVTRYATACFACSDNAGKWLFGESEFEIVRNAIELEKFAFSSETRNQKRNELGIGRNEFVVGHVGRFDDQKNHEFLIEVFRQIANEIPNAKLLLVGDGKLREKIETKINKCGIADRVLILGNREDVAMLYSCMDLFVLPSLFEGLGIVLIEAQANGLHSVASGNVPQEVNHGDAIKFVELSKKKWIEEILMEYKQSRKRQRTNYVDYLKKDGYDIHMAACELEKKYQELVCK